MKTRRSIAAALILALAPTLVGAPAFAQDDATTKAARARFQEGVDYYDKGQYESARAAFLQAYALRKHPAVLLNLAQSCLRSGHPLEAVKYFQQFLRESTSVSPAQRNDAEKGLTEARSKLGRLEISAPTGAEITVDGTIIGTAPLSEAVDVEPGTHMVRARMADGTADTKSTTPGSGDKLKIVFSAPAEKPPVVAPAPVPTPAPAQPPPSSGTTVSPLEVPPESHALSGDTPPDTSAKQSRMSMAPAYLGFGVGAAGFATAVVFYLFKQSAEDSAKTVAKEIQDNGGNSKTCESTDPTTVTKFGGACASLNDNVDKVNTNVAIANIGLGVGIAGVVFGGVWTIVALTRNKKSEPPPAGATWIRPVPMLFSNGNGVGTGNGFGIQGTF